VLIETLSGEMWEGLVVLEEGVVGDLKHVKNVGLFHGEGGVLRREWDDWKGNAVGDTWARFGAERGGPERVSGPSHGAVASGEVVAEGFDGYGRSF